MAVAGVGAAWHWRGDASRPMGPAEHAAISRLLDPGAPLLRAYGGMRFSAARSPAPEWRPFGTHLFAIPRLELVEGSTACLLCCNVVWDDAPAAPLKGSAEGAWGAPGCSVSAEEALSAALLALRGLQSPQTPRRGELRAGAKAFKHTPDRHTWASLMGPLHGSLLPAGCEEGQQPADGEGTPKGQEGEEGLTKVVLARRTDLELEGDVDPLQVLGALQERDSRAYQIFMQVGGRCRLSWRRLPPSFVR